jgi:hypothetical protein
MGDSWLDVATPTALYTRKGIIDGFAARSIAVPPGQIVLAGHGGDTTKQILASLPGVLQAHKPCTLSSTAASTM